MTNLQMESLRLAEEWLNSIDDEQFIAEYEELKADYGFGPTLSEMHFHKTLIQQIYVSIAGDSYHHVELSLNNSSYMLDDSDSAANDENYALAA